MKHYMAPRPGDVWMVPRTGEQFYVKGDDWLLTEWGWVSPKKYRYEETYCDCSWCEGHEERIPLERWQWQWRYRCAADANVVEDTEAAMFMELVPESREHVVNMADMPKLEATRPVLFEVMSKLGKE